MTTTYEELYSRVLLRLDRSDGKALLAAKESINTAQKVIARVQDFDELITTDTANAACVANQANYHVEDDWGLTRPKDILSVRLMDESSSRKLIWKSPRQLDEVIPYPDQIGTMHPEVYTQRGRYVELIPRPDSNYSCYIMHSQWPLTLANDADQTSYEDIDDVIIELGAAIADDILNQRKVNREGLARELLAGATREEMTRPDQIRRARPFQPGGARVVGEYWKQPHWRRNP